MSRKIVVKEKVAAVSIFVISFGFNVICDPVGRGYYFSADNICISEAAIKTLVLRDADCKKMAEEFLARYAKEARKNLPTAEKLADMIKKKIATVTN